MRRVLAIVGLRLRLMARRSRGASGAVRLIVTLVLAAMGVLFALGLALGFGLLTYAMVGTGDERGIRTGLLAVFYTFFIFGVILPILTGAMNPGFDTGPLRIFPITRPGLYGITLAATALGPEHLIYYPALAAVTVTGVILPGVHPVLGLCVVALLILLYVGWGNASALLVNAVMRERRSREIVGIVGITVLVILSLLPSMLDVGEGESPAEQYPLLRTVLNTVVIVANGLPPTQAAGALVALHVDDLRSFWMNLLGLASWVGLGLAIGYRVFDWEQFGGRGRSRAGERVARPATTRLADAERRFFESSKLRFVPNGARAVASKELRYLFRSVVGRFNLLIAPVFVLFVVWLFGRAGQDSYMGFDLEEWMLFGTVAYTTLFSNNFLANTFAWEGDGIRVYLLAPVPLHHVLFGKNLGVWIYNAVLLVLVLLVWVIVRGVPSPLSLMTAVLLYTICIVSFTTVGNLVSIVFPVARDISSIRNGPSQVGTLLSLLSLTLILGFVGLTMLTPVLLGVRALQPVVLLVLLLIVLWVYRVVVRFAGSLLDERKEQLIESLRAVD